MLHKMSNRIVEGINIAKRKKIEKLMFNHMQLVLSGFAEY